MNSNGSYKWPGLLGKGWECLMNKEFCVTEGKAEASSCPALPKQGNLKHQFTSMRSVLIRLPYTTAALLAASSPAQSSCELCSRPGFQNFNHPPLTPTERERWGWYQLIQTKMEVKGYLFLAPLHSDKIPAAAWRQRWESWVSYCGGSDGRDRGKSARLRIRHGFMTPLQHTLAVRPRWHGSLWFPCL